MKFLISTFIFALFSAVSSNRSSSNLISSKAAVLSDEYIERINNLNTTWRAGRNFDPEIYSWQHIRRLMGTKRSKNSTNIGHNAELPIFRHHNVSGLPNHFDARKKWPKCTTIGEIGDQGDCGACWAFGAVKTISDRICIHSRGKINVEISAEDLLACCDNCGRGCRGGLPDNAWSYYMKHGVVTGGAYGSKIGCQPYQIYPSVNQSVDQDCILNIAPTPKCSKQCLNENYKISYKKDKHYGKKAYRVFQDEKNIMKEILINGPVEASFDGYADFLHYQSGVYKNEIPIPIGGHSVKMIGWGVENGEKYWLCANSWNVTWGELGGFFKILRGANECGIEEEIVAGIPREEDAFEEL